MRWVKYRQLETAIVKRQRCKIAYCVRCNLYIAVRIIFMFWHNALITKLYIWVFFVKPKHFAAASDINYFLHVIVSNLSICSGVSSGARCMSVTQIPPLLHCSRPHHSGRFARTRASAKGGGTALPQRAVCLNFGYSRPVANSMPGRSSAASGEAVYYEFIHH